MSRSKNLPGRNIGLGVEDFTVTRKADEYLDATRLIESIGFRRQSGGQITGEWTPMPLFIGKASEVEQHAAFNAQGIGKRTSITQVLPDPPQHGITALHRRVLGHSRATLRNCDKFTRARWRPYRNADGRQSVG